MNRFISLLAAVLLAGFSVSVVRADSLVVQSCGSLPQAYAPGATRLETIDVNGNRCTTAGAPASRNFPGCTVGAVSAQCLAAATAVRYLSVQNTSAAASIACAFGATAALNSPGSFQLTAGQSASWGPNTAGVPSGALNCIASAGSTPLYVEWN